MEYNNYLKIGKEASLQAGKKIMEVYENSNIIKFENKEDNSPLTIADKEAHNIINMILKKTDINIISEESKISNYKIRKSWTHYWLIDPLDGTKEFIKKNGEFTVNIALIKKNKPIMGIVYCPVKKSLYWNHPEQGAFKKESSTVLLQRKQKINFHQSGLRVITSRSHLNSQTEKFISKLKQPKIISCGSSLKILFLTENKADIYPRFGPTMEWDTAAAHAIANSANIKLINPDTNKEIFYNKKNLLNPFFIAHP